MKLPVPSPSKMETVEPELATRQVQLAVPVEVAHRHLSWLIAGPETRPG